MAKLLSELSVLLSLNSAEFQKGLKGAQKSMDTFSVGVRNIGAGIAAAFTVDTIINFGRQAMMEAGKQQKAEAQLIAMMKARKSVTDELIKQADQLQWKTLFNDEDIIRAQAILALYTKNVAKLKELTPLVLDYATIMGIDLDQAAKQVGKALTQTGEAFGRTGMKLEGLAGSTERYQSVLNVLSKMMGVAESQIKNQEAALTQLDKAWGELLETMGDEGGWNIVTYNLQFAIVKLNDFLKAVEEAGGAWRMFLGISNIKGPGQPTDLQGNPLVKVGRFYRTQSPDMTLGTQALQGAGMLQKPGEYPNPYDAPIPTLINAIGEAAKEASVNISTFNENLARMQDLAENGMNWFGTGPSEGAPWGLTPKGAGSLGYTTPEIEQGMRNVGSTLQETINWASIAQTAFMDLGEAMAQAFQKGADFGQIFLQLLIKMAALIAGTAIGGPVGTMLGGVISGFGGAMFSNSAGGGSSFASKINYSGGYSSGEWRIRGEDLVYVVNKQNDKQNRYR